MSAPTAMGLLKMLDKRRTQVAIAALGDLDDAHHDALRRSLTAVPAGSRIDVPILLDSVRTEVAERAEAKAARRRTDADPWRYELLIKSSEQLLALRDDLRRRVGAGEGSQPFRPDSPGTAISLGPARAITLANGDVQADPDPDDDDEPAPRKRTIPRRFPRSVEDASDARSAAATAPRRRERVLDAPRRSGRTTLGVRAFDEFGSITSDPVHVPRPPWLIDAAGDRHDAE